MSKPMSQASTWIPVLQVEDYQTLRRRAQQLLRFESACTLTAIGLVHEMLVRLHGYCFRRKDGQVAGWGPPCPWHCG